MLRKTCLLLCALALVACGDDDGTTDDPMLDGDVAQQDMDTDTPDGNVDPADGGGEMDAGPGDPDLGPREACDTPGAIETVACGNCGTTERFCSASGFWELGACSDEGVCAPGTSQTSDCGLCGTQTQRCTTACMWENMGSCSDEGECAPGDTSRTADGCAAGETRPLTCNDSCTFEPGACEADGCLTPGVIETVPCGLCGSRERFCNSSNIWEYGACTGEGVCMPGTTGSQSCGMCGMEAVRCTDSCQWSPTGSCTGEGTCTPGQRTRTSAGCPAGETRLLECSATCGYTTEVEPCTPTVPVDVLFLVDMTGSHFYDVDTATSVIYNRCVAPVLGITDAYAGLAFYGDHVTAPEAFIAKVELGPSTGTAISTALTTAASLGGGDDSTLTALDILAGGTPPTNAVPFACSAGRVGGGCWRTTSQRIIVMLTDEGAKSGPDPAGAGVWNPWPLTTSPDWTTVLPKLQTDGTRLFVALDEPSITPAGQYEEMVIDLGGVAGDVYKAPDNYGLHCDAIVAKIQAIANGM